MITIIKNSFKFKNLFGLRKHKSVAYVFYFILMVLLSLLPQNLQIISNPPNLIRVPFLDMGGKRTAMKQEGAVPRRGPVLHRASRGGGGYYLE